MADRCSSAATITAPAASSNWRPARCPADSTATAPRTRLESLSASQDPDRPKPASLREERALELLDQINTPESLALLTNLAQGTARARLTRSAAASLRRVEASK